MPERAGLIDNPRGGSNNRNHLPSLLCGLFWLSVVVLATTVLIVFPIPFTFPETSDKYSPNEVHLIPVSSTFCKSIIAKFDGATSYFNGNITFNVLSKEPSLDGSDKFNFVDHATFSSYREIRYWSYYLYPGSNFHVSVCKGAPTANIVFYLIEGKTNFDLWEATLSSVYASYIGDVNGDCFHSYYNYTYNVVSEGRYYLAYHLKDDSETFISVSMDFYRTKYTLQSRDVLYTCTIEPYVTSSCTVGVPASAKVGLVSINHYGSPDNIDWTNQVSLSFYCSARWWLHAVITMATTVLIVVSIATIVVICCCVLCKEKKYTPMPGDNQPAPIARGPATSTTTTRSYETGSQTPPPPYSPSYDQPPKYH